MFKLIRITLLLILLAFVAFYSKSQRLASRSWTSTLGIIIHPINGDNGSRIVEEYIEQLKVEKFDEIDRFIQQQSENYGLLMEQATFTRLEQKLLQAPPSDPELNSNVLAIIWWGLKLRYWAFQNLPKADNYQNINVIIYYHEARPGRTLPHSLGLDKGLIAIVHAFASEQQEAQNNIIITHEFLHTLGATDKYNKHNEPRYPDGYAEPDLNPLFPQKLAEIMSGRLALSANDSRMADSLSDCIIGEKTAREINWIL